MSSKVVVPFNFQPVSVTTYTTTYTIPTGFYAYVTAFCDAGQSFSINGVVSLQGNSAIAASGTGGAVSAVAISSSSLAYTVPSGYYFVGQMDSDGTGVEVTIENIATGIAAQSNNLKTFYAGSGDVIRGTSTFVDRLTGVSIRPNSINAGQTGVPITNSFWVPQGTILTVSSARYTVTLYNNIS